MPAYFNLGFQFEKKKTDVESYRLVTWSDSADCFVLEYLKFTAEVSRISLISSDLKIQNSELIIFIWLSMQK